MSTIDKSEIAKSTSTQQDVPAQPPISTTAQVGSNLNRTGSDLYSFLTLGGSPAAIIFASCLGVGIVIYALTGLVRSLVKPR